MFYFGNIIYSYDATANVFFFMFNHEHSYHHIEVRTERKANMNMKNERENIKMWCYSYVYICVCVCVPICLWTKSMTGTQVYTPSSDVNRLLYMRYNVFRVSWGWIPYGDSPIGMPWLDIIRIESY